MVRSQQKPFTKRRVTHPRLPRGGFTSVARRTGGLTTFVNALGFCRRDLPTQTSQTCYCIILYFQRNLGGTGMIRYDAWRWNKNFTKDDFSDVKSCFFYSQLNSQVLWSPEIKVCRIQATNPVALCEISDTPKLQWFWPRFPRFPLS